MEACTLSAVHFCMSTRNYSSLLDVIFLAVSVTNHLYQFNIFLIPWRQLPVAPRSKVHNSQIRDGTYYRHDATLVVSLMFKIFLARYSERLSCAVKFELKSLSGKDGQVDIDIILQWCYGVSPNKIYDDIVSQCKMIIWRILNGLMLVN